MLRNGRDEVFRSRAGCLDILGPGFEDVLEVDRDVGEFFLEEEHDVFVMLAFLVDFGVLELDNLLETGYLFVEAREILLDDL